jgi:hypothetical protein
VNEPATQPAPNAAPAEKKLPMRTPRGAQATHPVCLSILAIPFTAVGAFAILAAFGVVQVKARRRPPDLALFGVATIFGGSGLLTLLGSANAMRRLLRTARMRHERPGEPWLADWKWNARGEGDGTTAKALGSVFAAACFGVFLVPFNGWAWFSGAAPFPVKLTVSVFDLFAFATLGVGVYHIIRRLKYGTSDLRFRRFPFFLGDSFVADFRTSADVRILKAFVFTLRCVLERTESDGGAGTRVACYEIWGKTWTVEPPLREALISIPLPKDARYSTRLAENPPRYWEFEVTGEAPGVDYGATFLVPVYSSRLVS